MSKAEIKNTQIKVTGKASSEGNIIRPHELTIRMNGEILRGVQRFEFFVTATGPVLVKMELLVGAVELDLDNVKTIISKKSIPEPSIGLAESLRRKLSGKRG